MNLLPAIVVLCCLSIWTDYRLTALENAMTPTEIASPPWDIWPAQSQLQEWDKIINEAQNVSNVRSTSRANGRFGLRWNDAKGVHYIYFPGRERENIDRWIKILTSHMEPEEN